MAFRTAGRLYKEQMNSLVARLSTTRPHFVRCIAPNEEKKAGKFDPVLVLEQMRSYRILEGIQLCRKGFLSRVTFREFRRRYKILTPSLAREGSMTDKEACQAMASLLEMKSNLYHVGKSWIRAGVIAHLEKELNSTRKAFFRRFQAHCRGLLVRLNRQTQVQYSSLLSFERVVKNTSLVQICLSGSQFETFREGGG
jgi:myosin heavy chain 9/10/11/14